MPWFCKQVDRKREAPYNAWNGNKHKVPAGPDVQVVRRDAESGIWILFVLAHHSTRRQMELAPQRVNVLLLVVHPGKLHQVVPDGRVRAVGPNHEVKGDFNLPGPAVGGHVLVAGLEPGLVGPEVGARELVVEEELDVGQGVEDVQEACVEGASVNCVDGLCIFVSIHVLNNIGYLICEREVLRRSPYPSVYIVVLRVLIQAAVRRLSVNHAPSHGDRRRHDVVDERRLARLLHGIDAPFRQRQVDGFCEVERHDARIAKVCGRPVSGAR